MEKQNENHFLQKPNLGRPRKLSHMNSGPENLIELKKKRIIHRDVERQRRQQMSSLYSTLRSLLPLQYLQGKRSICDHMHETVKYIRDVQSRIKELSNKRDELIKRLSNYDLEGNTMEALHDTTKKNSLIVRQRKGGVQVVLDIGIGYKLPISDILQTIVAERLEIVTYISTKIDERFLHTIESDVVDGCGDHQGIDVSNLQHKLTNLENFPLTLLSL